METSADCSETYESFSGQYFDTWKKGREQVKCDEMDVWKTRLETRERGLENCYLMTNGLGGFSSMTMTGAVSRNDHALLMACTTAPNCRYNMIHRLKEELLIEEGDVLTLSTQEFEEQTPEDGYLHLAAFSYEDTPIWRFLVMVWRLKRKSECRRKKIRWRFVMRSKTAAAGMWNLC